MMIKLTHSKITLWIRLNYSILLLLFFSSVLSTNTFSQSAPFSLSATLTPDYHDSCIETPDHDLITIAKYKGNEASNSRHKLERYDANNLAVKWQTEIDLNKYENVTKLDIINNELILFINEHDTDKQLSYFHAWHYNISNGKLIKTDTLAKAMINPWMDYFGKGEVKQSFVSAINSMHLKNVVTPLEYEYYITYSPNKERILVYRYDYSQTNLLGVLYVFDNTLQLLQKGQIPVDKGYTSYGFSINDSGLIYMYKTNSSGKVVLVQYNLETFEHKLLEKHTGGTMRENLVVNIRNENLLYMCLLNKNRGILSGITYSTFDFNKKAVFDVKNYQIPDAFKQKVSEEIAKETKRRRPIDWKNFEIIEFITDTNGNKTIVIEERWIESTSTPYNASANEHIKNWYHSTGTVHAGTVLIFSFDTLEQLKWKHFIVKEQETDVSDGINTISVNMDKNDEKTFRFTYTTADNSLFYNTINFIEIDRETGELTKGIVSNPEKFTVSRPYSLWIHRDKPIFIFVGRKGLLGKKTFINRYIPDKYEKN